MHTYVCMYEMKNTDNKNFMCNVCMFVGIYTLMHISKKQLKIYFDMQRHKFKHIHERYKHIWMYVCTYTVKLLGGWSYPTMSPHPPPAHFWRFCQFFLPAEIYKLNSCEILFIFLFIFIFSDFYFFFIFLNFYLCFKYCTNEHERTMQCMKKKGSFKHKKNKKWGKDSVSKCRVDLQV